MSRACSICCDSEKQRIAAEMLAEGVTDQTVATRIGVSRMSVSRHRHNHVIKPAQDRLAIVRKGAVPRQERQRLAAAAASFAPSPKDYAEAFFGLKAQAEKLARIEERLERMAALAEEREAPGALAQIAGQQLRGVEVGAKLAGTGGYAAPKAPNDRSTGTFSVNIHLGGHVQQITAVVEPLCVNAATVDD
jgi:transposase-like protein